MSFKLTRVDMWKNEDSLPSSSRGSIVSFGNTTELATINEREKEPENQVSLIEERDDYEPPPITRMKRTKFPSNNSLIMMYKGARRGRSQSMPFIQKALPNLTSETTKIFLGTLSIALSGLYCKLLVVLGISFPIAEVLSDEVPQFFYEFFYLYLYLVSLLYLGFIYSTLLKQRAVHSVLHSSGAEPKDLRSAPSGPTGRYGSFYLRMGAIAFGIGSMIYSGLELGRYFELDDNPKCRKVLMLLTPFVRMLFIIIQLQFIFVSDKQKTLSQHKICSKFGLMHMIATNLSVWSSVVVHETKREIIAYHGHLGKTDSLLDSGIISSQMDFINKNNSECVKSDIMGSVVQTAAPFLFPCSIEYSLICAVILYALWKNVCSNQEPVPHTGAYTNKVPKPVTGMTSQHFTVDCANAHKGLFAGIIVLVFTIISLIMFYALINHQPYVDTAIFQVNLCELVLYILAILATLLAMYKIKNLKYESRRVLELDAVLLITAQTGLYIYFTFSLIVGYFKNEIFSTPNLFITAVFGIIQSTLQTLFIIDAWWRRCTTVTSAKEKPARQLVTFLLLSNIAMWAISRLENARSDFHPTERGFYEACAWTIITQLSMPLAVFYRFHSTVCLCEIWKCTYKMRLH